jgi:hypothetical protein
MGNRRKRGEAGESWMLLGECLPENEESLPSSIPKPDRRIGTIEMVEGDISVVVNS